MLILSSVHYYVNRVSCVADLIGPPDIKNISENQTADEGDKVTLTCTAVGNPPSNISWIRIANKAPVTFPLNIGRHDEGGYRCIADNGFGIETRDVFITVQCKCFN